MKILLDSKRRAEQAVVLWVVILVVVIFLAVIAGIAYMFWQAIQKLKRPPDDSGNSQDVPVGSYYDGGFVQGREWGPDNWGTASLEPPPPPPGFIISSIRIYAASSLNPPGGWTNQTLLWDVPFQDWDSVLGGNGIPLEDFSNTNNFPSGPPDMRFYKTFVVGYAPPPATGTN